MGREKTSSEAEGELSTPSLGITSLRGVAKELDLVRKLSTPSLGITSEFFYEPQVPEEVPFNSLSRDHGCASPTLRVFAKENFQLPLSGSHR